jgi:hypothetical protein
MNQVRQRVQFLIIAMLMLNGLLLVMSRGEAWPLILLVILPIPTWYVVDFKRWYELPSWAANLIGLGIGGYAMYFFWFLATERHLAIVSDMVCYLLLTMTLQEKSPRLYWQITVLSVLQSVVASVFSLDLQQGLIFIFYTLVVLMALGSIVYYRDELVATLRMDRFNNMIHSSVHQQRQRGSAVVLRPTRITTSTAGYGSILFATLALAFFSVSAGMSIYVTIPRLEEGSDSELIQLKTTGISRQIKTLEPSGVLQPSNAEAFRVKILDPSGSKSLQLKSDLYMRGACFEKLERDETGWRSYQESVQPTRQLSFPAFTGKVLLQEIVIVPREDPMLFYALPVTPAMNAARDMRFDLHSEMLKRHSATGTINTTPFRYEVGLYGVEEGVVPDTFPFLNYKTGDYSAPLANDVRGRLDSLTEFDPEKFPRLQAQAKAIAATIDESASNRREVCKALENYLANSGEFQYTTDFRSIVRNRDLDPVEDFVANYRQGHCELYASALCLMLRSVGIPARVVVGYRTAKFNDVAGHYLVQEKHAHSWVEAYLSPFPIDCTEAQETKGLAGKGGAWLRLDATPPASTLNDDSDLFSQANNAFGFAQSLWDEYIMGIQDSGTGSERTTYGAGFLQALMDPTALVQSFRYRIENMSVWQRAAVAGVIVVGLLLIQRRVATSKKKSRTSGSTTPGGLIRRLLGRGANSVGDDQGPHWADELLGRLEKLATAGGFSPRKSSMTALEFARQWIAEIKLAAGSIPPVSGEKSARALPTSSTALEVQSTDNDGLIHRITEEISSLVADYYQIKYCGIRSERVAPTPKDLLNRWAGRVSQLQKELPKRSANKPTPKTA